MGVREAFKKMLRILVIGKGGREHAICRKLAQEGHQVFCAPGSDGISQVAELLPQFRMDIPFSRLEELWDEIMKLRDWALENEVDLVIVGPEDPLAAGIADVFQSAGLLVFGPTRDAARLETSKAFAKDLMCEIGVPTAPYELVSDPNPTAVRDAVHRFWARGEGAFVKASGLAAGKAAYPARDPDELEEAIRDLVLKPVCSSDAVRCLVVEQAMAGEEASLFAVTDGERYVTLTPAQDHKRIGEGDIGPNTGGMGAYAPAPVMTPELVAEVGETIIRPVLAEMRRRGRTYRGVLYGGLMITKDGPKVVEFNCRFGDPEAQAVLPLLKSDLAGLCLAAARGCLNEAGPVELDTERAAACVVKVSGGYPGPYEKGKPIYGLENLGNDPDHLLVFHAGTALEGETWKTAGGRVLNFTGLGADIPSALINAYLGADTVYFEDQYCRRDIGWRAMERLAASVRA